MTQASERQGPGMAIRQLLIEASVDASELPKHGSLGGLGGQQAGRRLRLSTAGHLLLAGAILAMAFSVVLVLRQAAQSRQRTLGYCNKVPIMLRQPYTEQQQQPGDTLPLATSINLKDQILALPTATPPQKQRLVQQARSAVIA
jgi:hypothetical protein